MEAEALAFERLILHLDEKYHYETERLNTFSTKAQAEFYTGIYLIPNALPSSQITRSTICQSND